MNKNLPRSITIAAYAIFAFLAVSTISFIVSLFVVTEAIIFTNFAVGLIVNIAIWGGLAYWILQGNKIARIIYTVMFGSKFLSTIIELPSMIRDFELIYLFTFIQMGLLVFAVVQLFSNSASAYYQLSTKVSGKLGSVNSEYDDDF